MFMQPFGPYYGKTQTAAVNGAGAFTGLPASSKQLVLTNVGTVVIYVRATIASDATAASAADMPVLPNSQITISKSGNDTDGSPQGWTRLAYFSAGAGSSLSVTPGDGWMRS